jgi:hypothetical protein
MKHRGRRRALAAVLAGLLIAILLAAASAARQASAPRPGGPTTGPSVTTTGAAAPLPPDYAVLQSRDPFAHGGGRGGPGGPGGPGAPGGPESLFILRGTVGAGNDFTAFVEDTTAKKFVELPAGAPLGPGRIKRIDCDGIEFEQSGKTRRVEVGQDLAGRVVPPTPASQPAPPQPPQGEGPPQGPPNGPPPGPRRGRGGPPPQGAQPAQAQPG